MPSPREMTEQDRQEAIRRGDILNQGAQNRLNANVNRGNQYEDYLRGLYMPEAEGGGGYSPEEMEAIRGEEDLGGLQMTEEERAGAYLTPEEQTGVAGDPYGRMRHYDPESLRSMQTGAEGRQRGATQGMGTELRGVAGSRAGALREDYRPELATTLNQGDLAIQQGIEGSEGRVRGAIDRNLLAQSGQLPGRYRMSDQEKQDIITGAGISEGTGYRAAMDSTERAARAAGTDPLGVAAYRARSEREMSGAAGDAMTQARIGASREAAAREMALEQNRQQAEQYLSGATTDAEQALAARRLSAQNTALQRRIGAGETAEEMRMRGEQDVADRRMKAGQVAGEAEIGTERDIAKQQQDTGRWIQETGMEAEAESEQAQANRAKDLASNRQRTQEYLTGERYGRGMDINKLRSGRAQDIGNTRIGQMNKARGFFGGLQEQANTNVGQEANRQGNIYGTQGQLREGATRGVVAADQAPRWWERAIGAGAQAVGAASGGLDTAQSAKKFFNRGGVITQPTVGTVGEQGPEYVGAVGGRGPGRVVDSPTTALLGASGPEAVVPMNPNQDNVTRPSLAYGREVMRRAKPRLPRLEYV